MLHTDLGKITLARFIEVYCGDLDKVVESGMYGQKEKEEAAFQLCNEYLSIVGGSSAIAQINRRDRMLRLQMRLQCLSCCKVMMAYGDMDSVCRTLKSLGYVFKPEQKAIIGKKIESLMAADKFRLERMRSIPVKIHDKDINRDYFVKERVAVMAWAKMYIDENVFTAKEYAYLVKRMCDELEYINRQNRKKK